MISRSIYMRGGKFLIFLVMIILEIASGNARAESAGQSRKVKMMSTCQRREVQPDGSIGIWSRIVIGEGPTPESAKANLLNHCLHDARGGEYLGKVAICADGYYAAADTTGYCGAPSVKAAVLGFVRQFPKSATDLDKQHGITEVLASGIRLGYLTSRGSVEAYCEYVGADTKGNIIARDRRYGTGEAFCSEWNYSTSASGKVLSQ